MSTDESSPKHSSWLATPLATLTRVVLNSPRFALATGMGIAVLGVGLAVVLLEFKASRLDLLNPKSEFNQRWLAYLDEFGDVDDIVIVVDGDSEPAIIAAMDDVTGVVSRRPEFRSILHQIDLSALRSKGLYYLSGEELASVSRLVGEFRSIIDSDWNRLGLGPVSAEFSDTRRCPLISQLHEAQLSAVLDAPNGNVATLIETTALKQLDVRLASRRLVLNDGTTGIVLMRLTQSDARARPEQAIADLRQQIEVVNSRHEGVSIGLTGMPVLEHDEMRSSQRDTTRASVLSLLGVSCVFIAGFGGLRRPLLAVATLILGIAWSMGYITLVVGHLNILSVAFGVILIGLGIDFGIHYLARYLQERENGEDTKDALLETVRAVGPGVVTGGLTTALAFFTAGLTNFTGIAELGIVAGGGIVLCVVAALTMLPAMLHLSDRHIVVAKQTPALPFGSLCRSTARYPRMVFVAVTAITILLGAGLTRLRYDHNLLNLQPKNQQSVILERQLATTSDRGVWYAVSMCESRAELLERKAKFDSLAHVTATEEIASLTPVPNKQQQAAIASIAENLRVLPDQPPLLAVVDQGTFMQFAEAKAGADAGARLGRLAPSEYYKLVSGVQQASVGQLLDLMKQLRAMASPAPPMIGDLPEALADRYIGRTGKHLLKVYGHNDIWNMESLERFVRDVESVDHRITGHPIQTFYASSQMQRSYINAAVYSLIAVMIVLVLDFRTIKHSLLAMLPMGLGFVQLLGLLGWLGIPLNPANMIVLPLILGIGIDDGVHVVHDALRQGSRYQISNATASAVFLTSATTMLGFGSMMIASHQGLRSLGQVLTLGVFCCLVSSVLVLPVLLGFRRLSSD